MVQLKNAMYTTVHEFWLYFVHTIRFINSILMLRALCACIKHCTKCFQNIQLLVFVTIITLLHYVLCLEHKK